MEQYWIWLSSVEGIGPRRFYRLLSQYGDARGVWDNIGDDGMAFLGPKLRKQLRAARTEEYFFRLFAGVTGAEEEVGIGTYTTESFANFLTGALDINDDAVWEQYLADYSNYKLDRILEIRQACYDRFLAR